MPELKQYKQAGAVFAESLGDSIPEMERRGWTVNGNPEVIKTSRGRRGTNFDGSSDYLNAGSSNLNLEGSSISISFWINPLQLNSPTFYTFISYGGYVSNGWAVQREGSGGVGDKLRFAFNGTSAYDGPSFLRDGSWKHVVVTASGSEINFYVDGSLTSGTGGSGALALTSSSHDLVIGRREDTANQYSNGEISDLIIFDRALSIDEVNQIYTNQVFSYMDSAVSHWNLDDPNPRDLIGNNDGVGTSLDQSNVVEGLNSKSRAVILDGSNDYFSLGDISNKLSTEASVVCFLKLDASTPLGAGQTGIWYFVSDSGVKDHYPFTDGLGYFGAFKSTRVNSIALSSNVKRDSWHMVTVSAKPGANGWNLYQNDELITSASGDATIPDLTEAYLGSTNPINAGTFDGKMSKCFLFNKSLTQLQVKHLYEQIKRGNI
tara:strand:+ start:108933 stop:110231 length:1299 start_codon:yes stop_codon:yes gene_type:complete